MKKATFLFVVTACLAFVPVVVPAATITFSCASPTSCSLSELLAGGKIQVDGIIFENFTLDDASHMPEASAITVKANDWFHTPGTSKLEPGLSFDGAYAYNATLAYDARVVSGPLIADFEYIYLFSGGWPGSYSDVTHTITSSTGTTLFTGVEHNLGYSGMTAPSGSGVFADQAWVHLDLSISGHGADPMTSPLAGEWTQAFSTSAVPEPASLLLLGTGLVGLGRAWRRRRQ